MPEDRRLAAIMFTDIVGYTSLMGSDEDKAFDMLKRNHAIHESLIQKYNGTLIKEIGDGTLASFPLASDAVRCAMEIQKTCEEQNIPLKIGIHEGEMVFAGTDVLGDGVNIASRLQESAEEGCINISGKVYSDVKNKAGIKTKLIGDKTLKGVKDLVKVYEVVYEKEEPKTTKNRVSYYVIAGLILIMAAILIWQIIPQKDPASDVEKTGTVIEKSIAVLPFTNDSPDQENEYFCIGMMEEILLHLQLIKDLKVKSRSAVEKYREEKVDINTIGEELGIAYFIEGSVRKVGNDLRITVQLIDVKTGNHLWAETYDGVYSDKIFEFQSNIAKKVASSLQAVITPQEEERIDVKPTSNMAAHDLLLRGIEMVSKGRYNNDSAAFKVALNLFNNALEIDPEYGNAIRQKALTFFELGNYDSAMYYYKKMIREYPEDNAGYHGLGRLYNEKNEPDSAYKYISKSIELNPDNPWAYLLIGQYYLLAKNDIIKAIPYYYKAYDIAAEAEYAYGFNSNMAIICMRIGSYEESEKYIKQAIQSRQECLYFERLSWIYFLQGKFEKEIQILDSICGISDCDIKCAENRFYVHTMRKEYDLAKQYYNQFINIGGIPTNYDSIFLAYVYREQGKAQEADVILRSISNSLEERLGTDRTMFVTYFWLSDPHFWLSATHAIRGDKEESLKYLAEIVDRRIWLSWIDFARVCPFFENLWDDPEFKALVKRAQDEKADIQAQAQKIIDRDEIDL